VLVGSAISEVTVPPCSQRLIHRLFEAVVGLFHIAVLMSHPGIVPGRLHAVVGHERLVACGPLLFLFRFQVLHGGTQVIGPMLLGHSTQLPQRFFDAFSQRLEGFAEADAHRFRIGVGEHQVIEQVWERRTCQGDPEIRHVGEIRLRSLPWGVLLFKDHLLWFAMQGSPLGDVTLQRSHLGRLIAIGMAFTEQGKECFVRPRWVPFELCCDPGPVLRHSGWGESARYGGA